jgi:hypothetical protein
MNERLSGTPSSVVQVPVPREHLAAVYELLAQLMGDTRQLAGSIIGSDETPCPHCRSTAFLGAPGGAYRCSECGLTFRQSPPPGTIEVDHENGCWSEKMIHRLHHELGSSEAGLVLDLVAARSPATISSDELASSLNISSTTLRADLGALSKASQRLFGRRMWPMSARQGWGEGSRMGYRMPELVGQWWLAQSTAHPRHGPRERSKKSS